MRKSLLLSGVAAVSLAAGSAVAQTAPSEPTEVAPVTVLATRTATRVDEAPATVSVITDRQIEAMLATDIKDLVRYEPGVSVQSQPARFGAALGTAGRAGNAGFTIRGLGGDRVLTVVDGVRVPDGFVFGAQSVGRGGYADLDLMKSVEILRGPASALYGSDGVAGAVAFTTKDPADLMTDGEGFAARARAGYNSADEGLTTSAILASRAGAVSGLIAWTGRDAEETKTQGSRTGEEEVLIATPTAPFRAPGYNYALRTRANPQQLSSDAWLGKLVWDFADNQSLRLTYDALSSEVDSVVLSGRASRTVAAPPTAATAVLNLTARDTTERERVSLDWRFDDALGLDRGQVSLYGQTADTRQYTFEDRVGTDRIRDNTFDNDVFGFAADAAYGWGVHRLTFGGDWSETTQQGVRSGTLPPVGETFPTSAFPKTDYTLAGVFMQDEIGLMGGDLQIIPALRWDSYELQASADPLFPGARASQSGDRVSPKLGVVWWAGPTLGLFGSWSSGFKAPTPSQVNNFFSNPAFGYVSRPNPDLEPETSVSVEIGARLREAPAFGGRLSGQLTAFQADYEDFISQRAVSGSGTPADPSVFQFVNFTDVETWGLEARANLYWDQGLFARFAAAYAEGEIDDALGRRRLDTIDPIKVVLGAGYDDPSGRFGTEAVFTFSAGKDARDTDNLPCFNAANPGFGCAVGGDFAIVDLLGYWNVTDRVTARVGVFNVFDATYSWWSDVRGVSAPSVGAANPFGYPPILDAYTQPGRNVGLSLTLRY